jgi:hypothetical protein
MKKLLLYSLAVTGVLAMSPTAMLCQATNFTFDFSSPGNPVTLTSSFTIGVNQNTANLPYVSYTITNFSGTFTDTSDGVSGTLSLIPLQSGHSSIGNPSALEVSGGDVYTYDNQFYPGGAPDGGGIFDYANSVGLYVTPSGGTTDEYYVFLWGIGGDSFQTVDGNSVGGRLPNDPYFSPTTLSSTGVTFARVPEYGSFSMLMLCVLALAGALFYKARHSDRFLNS